MPSCCSPRTTNSPHRLLMTRNVVSSRYECGAVCSICKSNWASFPYSLLGEARMRWKLGAYD
ncbi:MAG: hypothetical protein N2035_09955 [Chthoniobacterales bacterium]|nr:hypothetical protein [Chthoniobacterales bacterium]